MESHGIWRAQKSANPAESYRKSRQDSRWEAKSLVAKPWCDPGVNLVKILAGSAGLTST